MPKVKVKGQTVQSGECPQTNGRTHTHTHTHTQTLPNVFSPATRSIKKCPIPWAIWTPSGTWFLGPTQPSTPNGNSIESAIFPHARCQRTDRTTTELDRYQVTNRAKPLIYSACATRPNATIAHNALDNGVARKKYQNSHAARRCLYTERFREQHTNQSNFSPRSIKMHVASC